jgi:hypothetical protein
LCSRTHRYWDALVLHSCFYSSIAYWLIVAFSFQGNHIYGEIARGLVDKFMDIIREGRVYELKRFLKKAWLGYHYIPVLCLQDYLLAWATVSDGLYIICVEVSNFTQCFLLRKNHEYLHIYAYHASCSRVA